MSIFGFGTPPELQTQIGTWIKAATDNLRTSPDWSKNLDICDEINRHKEVADQASKAIRRRLQENEQQTVCLTLTLLEACMKNSTNNFAPSFDRTLMDEIVNISKGMKGNKNADESLRLIQQWGRNFERNKLFPLFWETYMSMKNRGIGFPPEEPLPDPKLHSPSQSATKSASKSSTGEKGPSPAAAAEPEPTQPNENELEKLKADLSEVVEKVKLCREMLLNSPGIQQDEALADVIGFLEACRDRMVDLVEAGFNGLLGEELFERVLKVNDAVTRTLDAERNGIKLDVEDAVGENAKPSDSKNSQNLLDLDSPVPASQPKTKHQDELFGLMESNQQTAQSNPSHPTSDPFEAIFGPNSTTQHTGSAAASVSAANNNPFDDTSSNNAPLPPPPTNSASKPQNVHTPDEFDMLFNSTPTKAPAPPAQTKSTNQDPAHAQQSGATTTDNPSSASKPQTDDFDDFFASLK